MVRKTASCLQRNTPGLLREPLFGNWTTHRFPRLTKRIYNNVRLTQEMDQRSGHVHLSRIPTSEIEQNPREADQSLI